MKIYLPEIDLNYGFESPLLAVLVRIEHCMEQANWDCEAIKKLILLATSFSYVPNNYQEAYQVESDKLEFRALLKQNLDFINAVVGENVEFVVSIVYPEINLKETVNFVNSLSNQNWLSFEFVTDLVNSKAWIVAVNRLFKNNQIVFVREEDYLAHEVGFPEEFKRPVQIARMIPRARQEFDELDELWTKQDIDWALRSNKEYEKTYSLDDDIIEAEKAEKPIEKPIEGLAEQAKANHWSKPKLELEPKPEPVKQNPEPVNAHMHDLRKLFPKL